MFVYAPGAFGAAGAPGALGAAGAAGAPGAAGFGAPGGIAAAAPSSDVSQNGHLLGSIPSTGNTICPQFGQLTGLTAASASAGLKHMTPPFLVF